MRPPRLAASRVLRWMAGFTLVEVVITLAMMAVLGTLAMPSLATLLAHQRLKAAAHHLQADIALAKHESGRRGQPVHLRFMPGPHWCYLLSTGVAGDCHQPVGANMANMPDAANTTNASGVIKVVHALDHPGVTLLDAQPMVIDATHVATLPVLADPPGLFRPQARFAGAEGLQLLVRLGPQSRGTVCAVGAAMGGLAQCSPAVDDPQAH